METALELIKEWDDVPVATVYRLFDDDTGRFGLLNKNGSVREVGELFQEYADLNDLEDDKSVIEGTSGNDNLIGDRDSNLISGLGGKDTLKGLGDSDTLEGDTGRDKLFGQSGADELSGGFGRDKLYGGNGNDSLDGGSGKDRIYGGSGDDLLFGDNGWDRMNGGSGDDFFLGGKGRDVFIFSGNFGVDFVGDFTIGEDRIKIKNTNANSFPDLEPLMSEFGGNTFITFEDGNEITLESVTMSDLSNSDFIFA